MNHGHLAVEKASSLNSSRERNFFLCHPIGSYKTSFCSSGILDSHLQQFICDAPLAIVTVCDTQRAVVRHCDCGCFCQHPARLPYCFFPEHLPVSLSSCTNLLRGTASLVQLPTVCVSTYLLLFYEETSASKFTV